MAEDYVYVIDTSALVEMRIQYPEDVFGTLWNNLSDLAKAHRLLCPKLVLDELGRYFGDNEARRWAARNPEVFVLPTQSQIIKVQQILQKCPRLIDPANQYEEADPYVIALALDEPEQRRLINDIRVVITHESSKKRDKIPFACNLMGAKWLDIMSFFRRENWRF